MTDIDIKNYFWNLFGQLTPLLAAFFSIPIIIEMLGVERFGVLSLGWVLIGYFSIFDLGLGRAMTRTVARRLANEGDVEIADIVYTGLSVMVVLGLIGMIVVLSMNDFLLRSLTVSHNYYTEIYNSLMVFAFCVPIVILSTGLVGILEAYQKFKLINFVRMPMGVFGYLIPAVIVGFYDSLYYVVLTLLILRIIGLVLYFIFVLNIIRGFILRSTFNFEITKSLFLYGGWVTISNTISPLMTYLDRFVVAGYLSLAIVSYYTTPYDVIIKLLIIPSAIASVLFPVITMNIGSNINNAKTIYYHSLIMVASVTLPIIVILYVYAPDLIQIWISKDFSNESAYLARWLLIGIAFNCLAQMPYMFIQAGGRPDLTAKLHMIEFPIYAMVLYLSVIAYGVEGVAVSWVLRAAFDACILFIIAQGAINNGFSNSLR